MQGTQKYPALTMEQVALSITLTAMAEKRVPGPREPGQCAAFQRTAFTKVLGVARAWQPGPDAIEVGRQLERRGFALPAGAKAEVGDLLVWSEGHGPHGHISARVIGNRVAENSSIHAHGNGDARGFRKLKDLDPNYRVYRLWK